MFALLIYFLVGIILVSVALVGIKQIEDATIQKWARLAVILVAAIVMCWFLLGLVSGGPTSMGHVRLP